MRKIAFICFDQFQSLDITGPLEVLTSAALSGDAHYESYIISKHGGMVSSSSGLCIATEPLKKLDDFDSMIVVGGLGVFKACEDKAFIHYLKLQSKNVRRLASVCIGSFLLAKAGLLNGKKATTHWRNTDMLAKQYPDIRVKSDALYVRDGNVMTSAGATAGMDLALSLVDEDIDRKAAMDIARELLIFYPRSGGQSQFSTNLKHQTVESTLFQTLCHKVLTHPDQDYSVAALARGMYMSERHFSRRFTKEVGISPGKYIEQARLETAKRLLEDSQKTLNQIAECCGFSSAEILRRTFQRHYGLTPSQYRHRFSR